jgi:hypothetical protein
MKLVRTVCGALIAVCLSGLALAGLEPSGNGVTFYSPFISQNNNNLGPRDSIEAIVKDATAEGGSVVLCRRHHCLDLATHEDMGDAQDGYYILFDKKDPGYQDKLQKYQSRIRNWIEQN